MTDAISASLLILLEHLSSSAGFNGFVLLNNCI